MALINCPECGKEISDKAVACPHCGCPINAQPKQEVAVEDNEEYVFCPKCMSTHVHTEQKGFSGGKALAGAVAFGGIGLLAGTIGSKNVNITCLKCGHKFKAGDAFIATKKERDEILSEFEGIIKKGKEYDAIKFLVNRLHWNASQASAFKDAYLKGHKEIKKEMEENTPANPKGCLIVGIIVIVFGLFLIVGFSNGELGLGFWIASIVWIAIMSLGIRLTVRDEKEKQRRQKEKAGK